ncbi:class I SAM-dependent methyltransferase [Hephaestia mangrovi]|uniref:class I SAM-dependent methyltransferase n=1 Tax=Hephaestia mangrovi TaxID=2873268 RepID=UPI001CA62094|nr:class I SAM-dependent methyltransferase [Hephaestia mangrovi]MBY8827282.1 class I SAM-dependent methyltransferase [Hephaestia mangrovi]
MTEARDWTGRVGDVWAAEWQRTDRSFGDLAVRLDAAISAAAPDAGRALDIGCGAGSTSLALARARPQLAVTGADLSPALLAVARQRAASLANLEFVEGDVLATAARRRPIDLMVSRHGVMFFADPVAAFAAFHAAAAPGARLVFTCFRSPAENAWTQDVAVAVTGSPPQPRGTAPGPYAFADRDRVATILASAGWSAAEAQAVDYLHRTGAGDDPVADSLAYFQRIGSMAPILREMPPAQRAVALDAIAAVCARYRHGDAVDFPAAAWLWSARA